MSKKPFKISEMTVVKIIYAMVALISGLTVGVVVATFVCLIKFLETLISFPLEVYRMMMQSYKTRIMMQAFMPQSPEQSEDEEENKSESEKMWDRHIARIKRNNKNN
tara:strand:- start:652 stop:972 length:321 start_codon:yes stop_codon:yes gene_type:complete